MRYKAKVLFNNQIKVKINLFLIQIFSYVKKNESVGSIHCPVKKLLLLKFCLLRIVNCVWGFRFKEKGVRGKV